MGFADDLAAVALELVREFGEGRTMTLQRATTAPADPAKPWQNDPQSPGSNVPNLPAVVVTDDSVPRADNSNTVQTEIVLIPAVSLGTIEPTVQDSLLDGTTTRQIIQVERIKPGPTGILWKLTVGTS